MARTLAAAALLARVLLLRECGAVEAVEAVSTACDPFCSEWTCVNTLHCDGCGVCEAVRLGRLSADYCKSEVYGDRYSIFYELWGPNWERLKPGGHACWDDEPGGAAAFFEDVFTGRSCQANWFTAAKGELAAPAARPRFTGAARAVLGFDPDIFNYCSDLTGQPHWCVPRTLIYTACPMSTSPPAHTLPIREAEAPVCPSS
jgi:hypothetical protein